MKMTVYAYLRKLVNIYTIVSHWKWFNSAICAPGFSATCIPFVILWFQCLQALVWHRHCCRPPVANTTLGTESLSRDKKSELGGLQYIYWHWRVGTHGTPRPTAAEELDSRRRPSRRLLLVRGNVSSSREEICNDCGRVGWRPRINLKGFTPHWRLFVRAHRTAAAAFADFRTRSSDLSHASLFVFLFFRWLVLHRWRIRCVTHNKYHF